jgi:hypothetical protein
MCTTNSQKQKVTAQNYNWQVDDTQWSISGQSAKQTKKTLKYVQVPQIKNVQAHNKTETRISALCIVYYHECNLHHMERLETWNCNGL